MPRKAQGTSYLSDGCWYARVVVAPKKTAARGLRWVTAEPLAKEWAAVLQELVDALRAAARTAEISDALSLAVKVGADDEAAGLERVRQSVAKLRSEKAAARLTGPTATKGGLTFKKFARRWTCGELHADYPDHIPLKKSAATDAGRLELYVYPALGNTALTDITLKHAQDVLRRIPGARSTSTRRHVAQVMVRILNLAVYPCELLKVSPLPKGFLPKVKVRPGGHLHPSEDRALLACVDAPGKSGVPLVYRLVYGFLAREGMRKEEALAMTWSDLDLERGAVRLDTNKTDDPRAWVLDPGVTAALTWWKETHHKKAKPSALVFDGIKGRLAEALQRHLKAAGIDRPELAENNAKRRQMNVHGLRSTFVTISLANGRSETWVMDRTGHRSSAMVNRYRRIARTVAELALGPLTRLDHAIPETGAKPKRPSRRPLPKKDAGKMREGSPVKRARRAETSRKLAEGKGFEPPVPLRVHLISNQAPSTTRSPLQGKHPN